MPRQRDNAGAIDATPALVAMLGNNSGPHPQKPDERVIPDYGVEALLMGDTLQLRVTLRSGSHYCCSAPGCHLPLDRDRRWDRLRSNLEASGIAAPPQLKVALRWVVEAGAFFFDFSRPHPDDRLYYAFTAFGTGRESTEVLVEAMPESDE